MIQGRNNDAETHLLTAIDGSRNDGNAPLEASALCNLSRVRLAMGNTSHAIGLAREGIRIYDRLGLTLRLANARYALGLAYTSAGRASEALTELTEALRMFRANRQRLWEGTTHFRIAQAYLTAHLPANAAQHAEQALAVGCIGATGYGPASSRRSASPSTRWGRRTAHAPAGERPCPGTRRPGPRKPQESGHDSARRPRPEDPLPRARSSNVYAAPRD